MSTIIERTQDILIETLERAARKDIDQDEVKNITLLSSEIIKVGNLQVKYMSHAGTLGNPGTVFGEVAKKLT